MTDLNLASLGQHLPDQSITWAGFGLPVVANLNNISGDELTPESICLEPVAKLLEGLLQLQTKINSERTAANLPKIDVVSRRIEVSADGNPIFAYTLSLEVNPQDALNSVVNPLV